MFFIRQNATHKVVIGPAVAVGDGFTPVTNVDGGDTDLQDVDEAEAILHDNGTVVDLAAYTFAPIATADGYYHLTLQAAISGTVGHLTIVINDDSLILPLRADFTVMEEAAYDAMYKASAVGPTTTKTGYTLTNLSDANAAKLEDILDGTGGTGLTLNSLVVNGSAAGGVIDIDNSGGPGIKVDGTSYGVQCTASANGSSGLRIQGHTVGLDLIATAGAGFKALGTTWGIWSQASAGSGARFISAGGNGHGLTLSGNGTGKGLDAAEINAILGDTAELQADDVPGLIAALNNLSASDVNAEVVDALQTDTPVDGKSFAASFQIIAAACIGKVSGAGSGTEVFKGLDGSTTRATVTVDDDGNRSAVSYV